MPYILHPRNLKFRGDSTKIPHYDWVQAERLCNPREGDVFNYGSIKSVYCTDLNAGYKTVQKEVGRILSCWFGWHGGKFTVKDFTFTISETEIDEDGLLWLIPSTTNCKDYHPIIP